MMIKEKAHSFLVLLVFFDLILLLTAFIVSRQIAYSYINLSLFAWTFKELVVSGVIIVTLFIALEKFEFSHTYRFKPNFQIIKSIVFFELFLFSIFYIIKILNIYEYWDKFVFFYAVTTFSIFFIERLGIKYILGQLRKIGIDHKNFLIVGAGEIGLDFYRHVVSSNDMGVRITGFLDDNKNIMKSKDPVHTDKIKSLLLGPTDKLEMLLKTKSIDSVIITLPMNAEYKIIQLLNICEKHGIKAELIPRYFKIITGKPSVRNIKKFTLIGIRNVPLENLFNRFIKRIFDLVLSTLGIIVSLPFFLLIAFLIKIQSKGPVFFLQKRTGFNQKDFNIIKFRTMKISNDANIKQATKDDPRKTMIGDFLRKTNLDELPQLLNIISGNMSLVGPRPHMLYHTEEFFKKYDKYLIRHWVKPGITGWAQVNGWRGDSDIGMRIIYDIDYIENWSIFFDIKILFLTFFGKKVKKNAY